MTPKYVLFSCAALLLIATGNYKSNAAPQAAEPDTAVAPTITTQPANATVKLGSTATFSVVASGTAPLKYQWYKSGTPVGTNALKYTTPATTDADNGAAFTVFVSNTAGSSRLSNPAYLTVVDPPIIEEQPSSVTVTTPGVAEFDAYAYDMQGHPLTCQWYKNGHAIAGATNCNQYITEEITAADNGAAFTDVFTVTVNGVPISTTSHPAILTVKGSTPTGTYPIVGNWSGTATIANPNEGTTTSQVIAAFSQTSYSIVATVVFTDDSGIPNYGAGVASLNGQNVYSVISGDNGDPAGIAAGFTANLLTLNGSALDPDGSGGSGTLTISSDHNTLTGTATDTNGDTITWKLTREN
jgi:hypothetical protein